MQLSQKLISTKRGITVETFEVACPKVRQHFWIVKILRINYQLHLLNGSLVNQHFHIWSDHSVPNINFINRAVLKLMSAVFHHNRLYTCWKVDRFCCYWIHQRKKNTCLLIYHMEWLYEVLGSKINSMTVQFPPKEALTWHYFFVQPAKN